MDDSKELIGFAEAAALIPAVNGKRLSPYTIYRWSRVGIGGTKLEVVRVGRRLATTRAALARFMAALGNQVDLEAPQCQGS